MDNLTKPDFTEQTGASSIFEQYEYTVSELASEIRLMIEANLHFVRVKGEISGLKLAASGHCYFNVKDDSALLACTCWKSVMSKLQLELADGMQVVISGKLTTYAALSRYQLSVEKVEAAGSGNLMQLLNERKQRLEKEGLFDKAHKKPLPFFPKKVGVITSPTGAVIQDIIHRIQDRFPTQIMLWPVTVQGPNCASEVSKAIEGFNNLPEAPDVIIVARGGGSIEDLWPFNEEIVVRAVFASKIPVVSAVGHETDFTLIDFVSDVRAPTPTAAAEFITPVLKDLKHSLHRCINTLQDYLNQYIEGKAKLLTAYSNYLNRDQGLDFKQHKLDDVIFSLQDSPKHYFAKKELEINYVKVQPAIMEHFLENSSNKLSSLIQILSSSSNQIIEVSKNKLTAYYSLLESLDVQNVLKRGFVIVRQSGRIVTCSKELCIPGGVSLEFQDKLVDLTVK